MPDDTHTKDDLPEVQPLEIETGPGVRSAYGRVLSHSGFRRLWLAQFVSGIGDWLVIGFLIPMVTALSGGSSFAIAGILIAKIIPALLFSSAIGALVDRYDRKRVMIAADLARAGLTLVLFSTNSLGIIYLTVLLMETASLFYWPARNALIPRLVDEDDVVTANGLAYTTQQASMVIGLTASSAVLAAFEAIVRGLMRAGFPYISASVGLLAPALLAPRAAGVVLNMLSFLFSAAVTSTIKVRNGAKRERPPLSWALIGVEVRESFAFLRQHRELRGLLITIFLAILGGGAIVPVGVAYIDNNLTGRLPFLSRVPQLERLAAAPVTFALLSLAVGMVIGALVAPRLARVVRLQLLFARAVAAFGVSMLAFALTNSYSGAVALAAVAGACVATVTVSGNTYVQRTTEDELLGRVFTALESVIRLALLISMLVMAPLPDLIQKVMATAIEEQGINRALVHVSGARVTLILAAGIVIAASVYAFKTLSWRRCDEPGDEDCAPGSMGVRGNA